MRILRRFHWLIGCALLFSVISGCTYIDPSFTDTTAHEATSTSESASVVDGIGSGLTDEAELFDDMAEWATDLGGHPIHRYHLWQTSTIEVPIPEGSTRLGVVIGCADSSNLTTWKVSLRGDAERWSESKCDDPSRFYGASFLLEAASEEKEGSCTNFSITAFCWSVASGHGKLL